MSALSIWVLTAVTVFYIAPAVCRIAIALEKIAERDDRPVRWPL